MSLDATTKQQLVEARKAIIAQMSQLEFRVRGRGAWRQRGSQDAGDVYDTLRTELREIDQLLGRGDEEAGPDQLEDGELAPTSEMAEWPTPDPSAIMRPWAICMVAVLAILFLGALAFSHR